MTGSGETVARSSEAATAGAFCGMMRGFPTGVAIVTATDLSGRPWGMTCSSVCSVTLSPPTLLACLRAGSPTLAAILIRGEFAVNLLHERAQPVAELFASGRPDRYDLVSWHLDGDDAGPHLRADSHAIADCRLHGSVPAGDHVVIFGEVFRVTRQPAECRPLLYGLRRYSRWPHS
jgi:flavin reductase (DIM6/NTAB) family NADH-FMN oxidoreductase RutF